MLPFHENQRNLFPNESSRNVPGQGLLNTPNRPQLQMRRGRGGHGLNSRMAVGSQSRGDMNPIFLNDMNPMQAPQRIVDLSQFNTNHGGRNISSLNAHFDDMSRLMGNRSDANPLLSDRGDISSIRGGRSMMNQMAVFRGNMNHGGRGVRPLFGRGQDATPPLDRHNTATDNFSRGGPRSANAAGRNNSRFMDDDGLIDNNKNCPNDFMQPQGTFEMKGPLMSRHDSHERNMEFRRTGPPDGSVPPHDHMRERQSGSYQDDKWSSDVPFGHQGRVRGDRGNAHQFDREHRHNERNPRQMEIDSRPIDRPSQRVEDNQQTFGREFHQLDGGLHQHEREQMRFERGPQQFQRGHQQFERELLPFGRGPQQFERDIPSFGRGPQQFDTESSQSERGPQQFDREPEPFGRGSQQLGREPTQFGRGPQQFENDQMPFARGPQQFEKEPPPFGRRPQQFDREAHPLGRGPQPFERGRHPIERDPRHDMYDRTNEGVHTLENDPSSNDKTFHPMGRDPQIISDSDRRFNMYENVTNEFHRRNQELSVHEPVNVQGGMDMQARMNAPHGGGLMPLPVNLKSEEGIEPAMKIQAKDVLPPPESLSGRKTLLSIPPVSQSKDLPPNEKVVKKGILPAPDTIMNSPATASSTSTANHPASLLPPPFADISRPPPGFDDKSKEQDDKEETKGQEVSTSSSGLPHPSSILPPPEAVSAMKEKRDAAAASEIANQGVTVDNSSVRTESSQIVLDPANAAYDHTAASGSAVGSTSVVPLHMPPPHMMGYPPSDSVMNTSYPPPGGIQPPAYSVPPPSHADLSIPPPLAQTAQAANLSIPPPGGHQPQPAVGTNANSSMLPPSHDLSVPPPIASATDANATPSLPPLHLPPPGYDSTKPGEGGADDSHEKDGTAALGDLGDEEYLRELREWHKQIETYENQMAEYFQKCRDRLMEIYPSDPNTADEATREAYQTEYEKLQQEYQNFVEYMQPMREYYAEATAQVAKEAAAQAVAAPLPATAPSDMSMAPPPPMPEQEPPPPPPPPNEAAPTESPADLASNSLKQLAEDYGGGEGDGEDSIPAAQYYSQYYRQMIDYYQQLLKSMQGEEAAVSSSGDSSDEEMKNLNKNQRKKLRKKKKMKKKNKDGDTSITKAVSQQPPPPQQVQQQQQPDYGAVGATAAGMWGDWSHWYGYGPPVGATPWSAAPPPAADLSMLGTGMEWQEVVSVPPPPTGKPSVIQQQVALTNKQLMDHPTVADGVAGYGANIPAPQQEVLTLQEVDGMASVGVGSDVAGQANTAGLQPHMSAVMAHVHAMSTGGMAPTMVPPPPPLAQAQPGSIFTEESQSERKGGDGSKATAQANTNDDDDDDDDDEGDWSYCPTCDQKFTTERAYTVHLRGVKHMQNALEKAQKKDPDKFKEEREAELEAIKKEDDPEKKHLEWMIQQSVKRRGLGSMGSFFCELCNVECTSEKALAMHLNGTKHALRVDQLKSGQATLSSLQTVEDKRIVRKRAQLRIQAVLDQCLEALIGLNYINEYQREDTMAECRYHCQLCDFRFSPKTFMSHVTGVKHRKNFMKYNYSDMYEILDQDSSVKVVRAKRIDVYSRKIEEYEGRKRVSIKTEITDEGRKKEAKRERLEKEFHEQQQAEAAAEAKAKAEAEARAKENVQPDEELEAHLPHLRPGKDAAQLEAERRRRHEEQRRREHEERRRAAALAAAAERRRAEAERKRRLRKESKVVRQRAKAAAAAKAKSRRSEEEEEAELEEGEIASGDGDDSSLTDGEIIEAQFAASPSPPPHRGAPPSPLGRGMRRRGTDYDSGYPSFTEECSSGDDYRHPGDRRRPQGRPSGRYEGYGSRRDSSMDSRDRKPMDREVAGGRGRQESTQDSRGKKTEAPENRMAAANKDGRAGDDDDDEEEVGLVEEQDVEYEDAYVSERPPMTFQLKEDPERDEFIRGIKERKMLRLKELTPEAVKQFEQEADWVLARRKKADDVKRQEAAEEKRKRLEQLRRDEATILQQPTPSPARVSLAKVGLGGRTSSRLGLLLPDLGTEAGPARQQSEAFVQPRPGAPELPNVSQPPPQPGKEGAGVPLAPPNPALQMLMRNYQQMTGLGLQPPPPPRLGSEHENPEQLAELISTMKSMMQKFEAGQSRPPPPPRGNRPALLMPPPPKKPPSLFPLTKRRRLLGELLPESQEDEETPSEKRPRPTPGGGLLPLPEPQPPGQRRTLLGAAPAPPGSRKTLLGERPAPEPIPPAPYNKKVLFPTGPASGKTPEETEGERTSLLETPAAGEDSGEEDGRPETIRRLKSVVAVPPGKVQEVDDGAKKEGKVEKAEEAIEDVAQKFRAASGVKVNPSSGASEVDAPPADKTSETAAMEEGELEDDDDDFTSATPGRGPPPGDRFFDGYSLWRPPGPMGPGMHHHRPPFMGHMGFGPRRRPLDDDDHLRELMKKPDFRIHPMRRMGPGPGRGPAPGPGESRNLSAIAKLLGLNEPRPQRPPPPAPGGGKLPDVDVNQLKAILTHVHQHQRPGPSSQSSSYRKHRSDPKSGTPASNSGSKPNSAPDKA